MMAILPVPTRPCDPVPTWPCDQALRPGLAIPEGQASDDQKYHCQKSTGATHVPAVPVSSTGANHGGDLGGSLPCRRHNASRNKCFRRGQNTGAKKHLSQMPSEHPISLRDHLTYHFQKSTGRQWPTMTDKDRHIHMRGEKSASDAARCVKLLVQRMRDWDLVTWMRGKKQRHQCKGCPAEQVALVHCQMSCCESISDCQGYEGTRIGVASNPGPGNIGPVDC
jgi:hypothetical protein